MAHVQLTARSLDALLGEWRGGGAHYQALADRIRLLVLDGRIPIDTRLPAERDLAAHLELSRTTVTAAYHELRDAGFADSVRGSGSVARLPGPVLTAAPPIGGEGMLDFTKAALPAASSLPAAARAAAEELPHFLQGSGYDPVGLPHLREAIAARYSERGLPTEPGQILVTVGAQQAIALIARTFLGRGDRALVEMPTYPHASESLRLAGARLVPVTVTAASGSSAGSAGSTASAGSTGTTAGAVSAASAAWPHAVGHDGPSSDGWDVEAVEESIRRANPALAYLIPDFHNPTGASMSPETRIRILTAAAAQGTIVVGDETTAELDIDRIGERLPIAAYRVREAGDAPVILIGSASKSLWGGLRIGWIRADRPLIRKLIAAKPATDLGTPILEQLVVARMLPHMREIVEERRVQLRAGRESVRRLLAAQFPDWTVPELHGGLAAWVGIGAPVSSALALGARNHNLLIAAGPRFGIDGAFERFLRIPITYAEDETERAITSLSRAWTASLHTSVPYADPAALADVV